jgi:hypothetical protein
LDNGDDLYFDEEKGIINRDTGEVVLDIKSIYGDNEGDVKEEEKDDLDSLEEEEDYEEEEDL